MLARLSAEVELNAACSCSSSLLAGVFLLEFEDTIESK